MNKIDFNHRQSAHCENGVAANIIKYNGIDITEPLVFGMGSGLFFVYIPFLRVNQAPAISYRPMPGSIFARTAKKLNIKIKRKKFKNIEKSFQALDENLAKGIPTGLQVGVYHLPYLPDEYRFHFNAHNILVYGKEGDDYLISDPTMEKPSKISKNQLAKARFTKGVFAPKGHMYFPVSMPAEKEVDFEKAIESGIKKTTRDMLAPPYFVGVNGIEFVGKRILKWRKKEGARRTNHYLMQIIRMQEEIGTGGGGFRFIYAAFLQQASEILNKPELFELSHRLTEIGDHWRDFALQSARIAKNRNKEENAYQDISTALLEIAKQERSFFKDLKKTF